MYLFYFFSVLLCVGNDDTIAIIAALAMPSALVAGWAGQGTCSFCSISVVHAAKALAIAAHVLLSVDCHLWQHVLLELLIARRPRPGSLCR